MGKDGGAEAAHQLHSAIKDEVKATYPDAISDWSIVVQVVLNLQGLAFDKPPYVSRLTNVNRFGHEVAELGDHLQHKRVGCVWQILRYAGSDVQSGGAVLKALCLAMRRRI